MNGAMDSNMMLDLRQLDRLKHQAKQDPKSAIRAASRQFEAQFAQMLLSQMRQTSLAGDNDLARSLNSPAQQQWRGMLDQQMALTMAGASSPSALQQDAPAGSLGLARMLEKQLSRELIPADQVKRQMTAAPGKSTLEMAQAQLAASGQRRIQNGEFAPLRAPAPPVAASRDLTQVLRDKVVEQAQQATAATQGSSEGTKQAFLDRFLPAARRAESITGIPASFILGQAALESGWGRREIRNADGSTSHNLFGIKAGTAWQGEVVRSRTTEYIDGQPRRLEQTFRAYESYEASFEDYARLLASNPRYASVLQAGGSAERFAEGLQRAGYATDIRYAEKLKATIRSVQRAM